jgi:ATP-dependent DNA helicase RecG
MLFPNDIVSLSGKVSDGKNGLYIANPEFQKIPELPIDTHESLFEGANENLVFPVYRETKGITSRFLYHTIQKVFSNPSFTNIEEYLPEELLLKYKLPHLRTAFIYIHTPKRRNDADAARKRFAFDEIFLLNIKRLSARKEMDRLPAYSIPADEKALRKFIEQFPYTLTNGQEDAIAHVLEDLKKNHPMSRLIEGDVGSGKTAIAAAASFAVVTTRPQGQDFGNLQVAYMAPTEILAMQQFENFISYFKGSPIQVGLITGSICRKFPSKVRSETWTTISRAQLLKWVKNGEIPVLVGTHTLIQKSVDFKHLALAIVDEQHRFGTKQRQALAQKEGFSPHFLSMTATPIPRTLALAIYGDLDLTVLDEMPKGRKPIQTQIVLPKDRQKTYEQIRGEIKNGRQVYVICPRIDIPDEEDADALIAKSVTQEALRLKKEIFPEYEIGILHSKMTKEKKEKAMQAFTENKLQILVATSVVEVGVNVPNATVIIIEGAERFGLSQLHQLRGRVLRSTHQAYCYIFSDTKEEKSIERLKIFVAAKNGFELAERDLMTRGPGALSGSKQWGLSDLGMDALKNLKLVTFAKAEAMNMTKKKVPPILQVELLRRNRLAHFE